MHPTTLPRQRFPRLGTATPRAILFLANLMAVAGFAFPSHAQGFQADSGGTLLNASSPQPLSLPPVGAVTLVAQSPEAGNVSAVYFLAQTLSAEIASEPRADIIPVLTFNGIPDQRSTDVSAFLAVEKWGDPSPDIAIDPVSPVPEASPALTGFLVVACLALTRLRHLKMRFQKRPAS